MAWDPNKKGNPAWLVTQASKHGGVDQFIDDIRKAGYQKGHEQGFAEGAGAATLVLSCLYGAYRGVCWLVQKHADKKQAIQEKAMESEQALREIYAQAKADEHPMKR